MFHRKWDVADVRAEGEHDPVERRLDCWPAKPIVIDKLVCFIEPINFFKWKQGSLLNIISR